MNGNETWKLMPVKITREMRDAAYNTILAGGRPILSEETFSQRVWDAVQAAAPEPTKPLTKILPAFEELINRFETAVRLSGSDPEYVAAAVSKYRDLLRSCHLGEKP